MIEQGLGGLTFEQTVAVFAAYALVVITGVLSAMHYADTRRTFCMLLLASLAWPVALPVIYFCLLVRWWRELPR